MWRYNTSFYGGFNRIVIHSRYSLSRLIICLFRGHQLTSAVPADCMACSYCGRVWTWADLFRGRIPCPRHITQQAFDDRPRLSKVLGRTDYSN